jgi:hypothetical protein
VFPLRLLGVTQSTLLRVLGLTLAPAPRIAAVRVSESVTARHLAADFPSRIAPPVVARYLVSYTARARSLLPPHNKAILCWVTVWNATVQTTFPAPVHSSRSGIHWTVFLYNASTGAYQAGFLVASGMDQATGASTRS